MTGIVYGVCSVIILRAGDLSGKIAGWDWLFRAAMAAGSLSACVGFAVLIRNIQMKNMTGALFAGAAIAVLCIKSGMGQEGLIICAMSAFAAGAYDFYSRKTAKQEKTVKGGGQKWW
jgi:mannose/fructose/N-acetylgalactosamine-specific phosphotransferase system component IIC